MYAGQEATVRTGHGTTVVPNRKRSVSSHLLPPCLFNLYAEYIMRHTRLGEAKAGIKIARRNTYNLRYSDDTILMTESKDKLKLLDESERGE